METGTHCAKPDRRLITVSLQSPHRHISLQLSLYVAYPVSLAARSILSSSSLTIVWPCECVRYKLLLEAFINVA